MIHCAAETQLSFFAFFFAFLCVLLRQFFKAEFAAKEHKKRKEDAKNMCYAE